MLPAVSCGIFLQARTVVVAVKVASGGKVCVFGSPAVAIRRLFGAHNKWVCGSEGISPSLIQRNKRAPFPLLWGRRGRPGRWEQVLVSGTGSFSGSCPGRNARERGLEIESGLRHAEKPKQKRNLQDP